MTRYARILRRLGRGVVLAVVLALTAVVVPDSAPRSDDVVLVQTKKVQGFDYGSSDVLWILALGSDARPGQDMRRTRADAIQLVGIDPSTGAATSIGIPRDSWVGIPGHGSNRINAALYFGGPQLMGEAVGDLVGIRPDYVMVTRFKFFENMVNDIGGITVNNPRAFADPYLRPEGFRPGRIKLDGYGAHTFARIRKDLPAGDFDRSANQQRVLRGIHAKIRARAGERGFLEKGVLSVLRNTATDLPPRELFRIAHAVARVDPRKVTHCVLPGAIGNVGAASVVLPSVETARRYGDAARNDASIERC